MSHRKDEDEHWALALVQKIIDRSNEDRDALPGAFVGKMKEGKRILIKLQKGRGTHGRKER